tara:strand:- start:1359 stop:2054 length:696 start_codon:yes stop_codon:yes gene_type:complete
MWSGPRNLSTALMRSFENRNDTIVHDEPFYSYYLFKTQLNHPMKNEIIKNYSFKQNEIIKKITKNPKNKIYYQKHMTHHIIKNTKLTWIKKGYNCFLIRHPSKVINSYIQKNTLRNINDIGFKKQFEIFKKIKKNNSKFTVINADDILINPIISMKKLCKKLNINFSKKMINWPKGKRDTDGIWSKVWYKNVIQSSTFNKFKSEQINVPKRYSKIYDESLKYYEAMNKYSL